jgi:hypothetical protein
MKHILKTKARTFFQWAFQHLLLRLRIDFKDSGLWLLRRKVASNFYAVILWITYQEIKSGMHDDLTESHLDKALPLAAAGTVGALVPGQRSPDPGTTKFSFYH